MCPARLPPGVSGFIAEGGGPVRSVRLRTEASKLLVTQLQLPGCSTEAEISSIVLGLGSVLIFTYM